MISLKNFINEKLVINKEFKGRLAYNDNIENMSDVAKAIEKTFNNDIGGNDQISIKTDVFFLFNHAIYDNFKDEIKTPLLKDRQDECYKNNEFQFNLRGLPKNYFSIFFVENDAFIMGISNCTLKMFKQIEQIINYQFDIKLTKIEKDESQFRYVNEYYFTSFDNDMTYLDLCNFLCGFLNDLCAAFNIKTINRTIKQNEVLPGWTLDDIKKRYDNIFDDVRLMRSGNVKLGHLRESGDYDDSTFRIDVDIKYRNGIMIGRRKDGTSSSGNNFVLEPTVDKAFDELDKKLRKKGYTV